MATPTFPTDLGNPILSSYEYSDNLGNVDRTSTGFGYQTQKTIGNKGFTSFSLTFVFDVDQMEIFEDFYKADLINGHKWFYMNAVTGGGYDELTVRMTKEKYTASLISPNIWEVKFSIETDQKNFISEALYELLANYEDTEELALEVNYLYLYAESYPSDYTTALFKDDLDVSIWGY